MQKLVKRTAQAQKQASRRAAQLSKKEERQKQIRSRAQIVAGAREVSRNIKDARRAQKEDWELGPLAPRRDLGFNGYGVVQEQARIFWGLGGRHALDKADVEKRCAWAGGAKQLNLVEGDRVVLLGGPDKGKIDRIKAIDMSTGSLTLEKHNQAITAGMLDQPPALQSVPLPIDAVRLVYPITNPDTGVTRDVVINELKPVPPDMSSRNMSFERWEHGNKWDRLVPGINVIVPWPEVKVPEHKTHEGDTAREQVNDRTFHYGLLSPPMPSTVLDELRNPYSRFRTRHEPSYVAKKEAELRAKQARADTIRTMMTPLDELHEKQRQLKAARGEPELSDEMLHKIGEFIAAKKAAALGDAGVEEVSSAAAQETPPGSGSTPKPPGPQ